MAKLNDWLLSNCTPIPGPENKSSPEIKTSPVSIDSPTRAPSALYSVGLLEFLENHNRPVIIFDLTSGTKTIPVYSNPRLRDVYPILDNAGPDSDGKMAEDTVKEQKLAQFADWAVSAPAVWSPVVIFEGMEWTCQTLKERWRVVTGQKMSQSYQAADASVSGVSTPDLQVSSTHPESPVEGPQIERYQYEMRRAHVIAEIATKDLDLLSRNLTDQTHDASGLESRFRRIADIAPVGMFYFKPNGDIIYANECWYALTGHVKDKSVLNSWHDDIIEEDLPLVDEQWALLLEGKPSTYELRLKRPYDPDERVAGEKVQGYTWIITAGYPEKAADGTIIGVLGCVTDISRQKWAEGFQNRKMLEAIEVKRQQEYFIDMNSHEMRNPLSALIQCADYISTSIAELNNGYSNIKISREVAESYAEAAQTIVLCAQHQERIIDDVMMLSKVDSNLLSITPVESQPVLIIQNALRMFDAESQKGSIELRFQIQPSFTDLAIDWVKIDPTRVLQVLINLLTNAIKSIQLKTTRKIVIGIGASLDQPTNDHEVEYLPRSRNRKDASHGPAWGTSETVYLCFNVQNSGCGPMDHELNLLFQRPLRTSARTYVQYGGSLGLYISRELTELQGGQIGVASQAGVGSTFAFYIKARRCDPPEIQKTSPWCSPTLGDFKPHTKSFSETSLSRHRHSLRPIRSLEPRSRSLLLSPKHVLIVEDNLVNQKVLSKQLRTAGCIVSVANHGGEALDYLRTSRLWKGQDTIRGHELSLVLMDLEMPVMDGLTCVKRIRELQEEGTIIAHVPVIAVTANARSGQINMAKEAGMDSVVVKPFRITELIAEMDRQLRKDLEHLGKREMSVSSVI